MGENGEPKVGTLGAKAVLAPRIRTDLVVILVGTSVL